ncbi:hypothetical protein BDF14DRAFT_1783185 [Spinellus fusiger]|nr:hypothetical protein BDF14DRAFT_1783185 [Spinellus fusiger]
MTVTSTTEQIDQRQIKKQVDQDDSRTCNSSLHFMDCFSAVRSTDSSRISSSSSSSSSKESALVQWQMDTRPWIVVGITVTCAILWYCLLRRSWASKHKDSEEEERRLLLSSSGSKQTAMYYQWNRPPHVTSRNTTTLGDQDCKPNNSAQTPQPIETWEQRRSAVLKRYSAMTVVKETSDSGYNETDCPFVLH